QIDPKKLQATEPEWTFLGVADQRAAWTGTWAGTGWPLRVETAAFHGKPVGFALLSPWSRPARMPPLELPLRDQLPTIILICLALLVLVVGTWLARRNLKAGRSDRRGAFRLSQFIFSVHMLVFALRAHFSATLGMFGIFMVAIATSVFYAAL